MMTGWIRCTRWTPYEISKDIMAVYISVDQIQTVYEEVDNASGDIFTVIDMVTGEVQVREDIKDVLQKIKLARPVRS